MRRTSSSSMPRCPGPASRASRSTRSSPASSASPPRGGGAPHGAIADAIRETFGSFEALKQQLTLASTGVFGSGWAWLVHDGSGLSVLATTDQDSPLLYGATPLLGIDLWEHAYYLKFRHRRADYVEAFWNVVDWDVVAGRHASIHSWT